MSRSLVFFALFITCTCLGNERTSYPPLRYDLDMDGSRYIHFTGLNQVWVRHTDLNPGSTILGIPANKFTDIGIRRLRFQLYGQLTDRVFFYTQFGQNNFTFRTPRSSGAFFHDAVIEFAIHPTRLSMGGGLSAWNGLSRFASPSIGNSLALDVPLYQQATNDLNDQFLRKLSVYAKGLIGMIDYRFALSQPQAVSSNLAMPIQQSRTEFSTDYPAYQIQGYVKLHTRDIEQNTTPFQSGSHLGKLAVITPGAGFIHQSNATWNTDNKGDTARFNMTLLAADFLLDLPVSIWGESALVYTFYGAYHYYDFGPNYLRNVGVMNMADGVDKNGTLNGFGNAFPMVGTGNTIYAQTGVAFGENILTNGGKLQPYIACQYSIFEALDQAMVMTETGMNWFIDGTHGSKLSVNYQNRPIFEAQPNGTSSVTHRLGMSVLQYQVSF